MRVGERIVARVVEVKDNGIYLDHEGRSGIISVVELTWDETKKPVPEEFAAPGDDLELLVMTEHAGSFSGSLKRLQPNDDPRRHPALTDGSVLTASVRAIRPFGVLVDLPIGLVAMLAHRTDACRESLYVGATLKVVVTADEATGKVTARLANESPE